MIAHRPRPDPPPDPRDPVLLDRFDDEDDFAVFFDVFFFDVFFAFRVLLGDVRVERDDRLFVEDLATVGLPLGGGRWAVGPVLSIGVSGQGQHQPQ